MKLIDRNQCAVTRKDDLEHLYCFNSFPVFMGCLDQPFTDDCWRWSITAHKRRTNKATV